MKIETRSGGMGIGSVLLIVFVTLKLTELIDWSWWWVLSPVWIGLGIFFVVIGVLLLALAQGDG